MGEERKSKFGEDKKGKMKGEESANGRRKDAIERRKRRISGEEIIEGLKE